MSAFAATAAVCLTAFSAVDGSSVVVGCDGPVELTRGASGETRLVLSGGVFRSPSPLLLDALRETVLAVAPGGRPALLEAPPVVGAVLLAMEQTGMKPAAVREALIESTSELLRKN